MQSKATSVEQYFEELPEEHKSAMKKLRKAILDNLPNGFEETMSYGMVGYVVPHSLYPDGYHVDPKLPLPFMNIASQKNFVALYHSGVYAMPEINKWFTSEYNDRSKYKLDMGKSCIRFKKWDDIPFDLIGELVSKIEVDDWVQAYEDAVKNRRKK